jgi:hypothetical protein
MTVSTPILVIPFRVLMRFTLFSSSRAIRSLHTLPDAMRAGWRPMDTERSQRRRNRSTLLRAGLAGIVLAVSLSGCGVFCGAGGGSGGGFAGACSTGMRF